MPGSPQAGAEMDSPEPGDCERIAIRVVKRSLELSTREVVGIDLPGAEIADQEVGAELAETGGVGRSLVLGRSPR